MKHRIWTRTVTLVVALGLVAAACGGDDSEGTATATTAAGQTGTTVAGATTTAAAAAPVKGGIITIGQFSREPGLDPAKLAGGGTVGGSEAAAIFDTLLRYNPDKGTYEPNLAESFTANADLTEWTLKMRANLKFADGTPIDAAAAKWVLERQMKEGNSAPRSQLTNSIASLTVADPLTLKIATKVKWTGFPYLFVSVNGMLYSKAAFEKFGANAFNLDPSTAAAGPFKVKSYKPQESIELERNPGYWGGADKVNLDGVKFVFVGGASATVDAVKNGTIQGGFIREPAAYNDAKKAGLKLLDMPLVAANLITMNSGIKITCAAATTSTAPACAGQPDGTVVTTKTATSDLNVRKAVVAAVDPKVINDRAFAGNGVPNSAPFAGFPWDPKVAGPKFDLAEAKRLVGVAKTAGWDGKIRLASANTPEGLNWGEAVASQLEAAGMVVEKQFNDDTNGVVNRVLVRRDFDLATWAYGLLDESDNNYNQLLSTFNSANPRYGYGSAELDAAIDLLRTADTDAKRIAAYKAISDVWIRDAPAHVLVNYSQAIASSTKVNGLVRTGASITLYKDAWLAK